MTLCNSLDNLIKVVYHEKSNTCYPVNYVNNNINSGSYDCILLF